MIVGIDEVGRGPWAGPVVFGAVVLGEVSIPGLTDSKKLSKKRREELAQRIHEKAHAVGLGEASAREIDELGLSRALQLACRRALEQVTIPYDQIILDGSVNFLKDTGKGPYVTTMTKADLLVPSVSAASIVAKVYRDAYMARQHELYPEYSFDSHAGYGTASHRQALEKYGVTPLHRQSFAPIAALLGVQTVPKERRLEPTTTSIGIRAEDSAVAYLKQRGYEILMRNWKLKACEVDIIASKHEVIHFVEVKYRRVLDQGGGMAAITPTKLKQMKRASDLWFQRFGTKNGALSVIEVTGDEFEITQFLRQV